MLYELPKTYGGHNLDSKLFTISMSIDYKHSTVSIIDKSEMTHHLALLPFHLAGPIALVHLCLCSAEMRNTKVTV